jgi:DNA-directed RNA polymerase specialized sigma24 family protein
MNRDRGDGMEETSRYLGTDASDTELLVGVGSADLEALGEIFRRHGATVFAAARRNAVDTKAAEIVTAEVFVALWDEPDRAAEQGGQLRDYLIARTLESLARES